jgi:hypothetical protein
MIDFLKTTAKKTGGERRADEMAKRAAAEAADIDEVDETVPKAKKEKKNAPPPKAKQAVAEAADIDEDDETILPKAKKEKKRAPPPKANPVTEPACPEVKERTIKIVELKLGQHFFSHELGTMFVAVE